MPGGGIQRRGMQAGMVARKDGRARAWGLPQERGTSCTMPAEWGSKEAGHPGGCDPHFPAHAPPGKAFLRGRARVQLQLLGRPQGEGQPQPTSPQCLPDGAATKGVTDAD